MGEKEKGVFVSTTEFVTQFKWSSNKYQEKLALTDITGKIHSEVTKIDEELRAKQQEYNTLKSSLQAVQRKQTGNLSVRNLGSLNLDQQLRGMMSTENFTTVLVVVPNADSKDWLKTYETGILQEDPGLGFNPVLANSTKEVYKDGESTLWTVTLFKRKLQDFKTKLRDVQPRWTLREYSHDQADIAKEKEDTEALEQKAAKAQGIIVKWCNAMYGEVFRALMHVKVIRLFVESVLRYGVPPDFQAVVMEPKQKYEKKLHQALMKQFKHLGSDALYSVSDDQLPPGMAQAEFFPYVFLTLDVTTAATN